MRIPRGGTVTWTNTEGSTILITGTSGSGSFNSGNLFRGDSFSHTFTTDGTFSYSDGLHSWAMGNIIVRVGSADKGDLRALIEELRSLLASINSKLSSLESSVNNLTVRVTALESGGTPPLPEPTTGVKGKIYTDINNNNRSDSGERGRAGIEVIMVSLANHSDVQRMQTDANGDYTFERDSGGYLIQAIGGGPNSYAYITIPNNTMLVQNLAY